jgi:uncharacterized protein (DUF697 family)
MSEHLAANRRLIVGRALIAGAVGLVPVPYVDELLAEAVRGDLIRRLATLRGLTVDNNAVAALTSPAPNRALTAAGWGAIAVGGTRRVFRRLAASLLVVRRVDEAMHTFQVGTLFDHYGARHHTGGGLDGLRAASLRVAMDESIRTARNGTLERTFRRALQISTGAAQRLMRAGGLERAAQLLERDLSVGDAGYVEALVAAFDAQWKTP